MGVTVPDTSTFEGPWRQNQLHQHGITVSSIDAVVGDGKHHVGFGDTSES